MKTWIWAMGLVGLLVSAGSGAPVCPNAELKGLIGEYAGVAQLRNGWTRQGQSAEFKTLVKALQQKAAAYTRTHAGKDLDVDVWGRNLLWSVYRDYLLLALDTYAEGEQAIKELRELLDAAQPADERVAHRLSLELVCDFVQDWAPRHPVECASVWDEEGSRVAELNDPELGASWQYFDSIVELQFVDCAGRLPAGERQKFFEQRFQKFLGTVANESLPSCRRAKALRCWIVHLKALGRWQEASAVLDGWWTKYGETMTEPDYYLSRMWAAWYGEGDWDKASETLRRFSRLVQEGKAQVSPKAYKELTGVYYARISMPVYELRRQEKAKATEPEPGKGNKKR